MSVFIRHLAVLSLVVLLCTQNAAGGARDSSVVRIMTFNIRYGTADDGENVWVNRKELLFYVIRDYSPDILALQEALRFQIDDLRKTFPEYGEVGVGRDDGKAAGEYSAILYRSEKFSVKEEGTFWFSDSPATPGSKSWGNEIPRICTWAILHGSSLVFTTYNLHLDHQSQPSREQSVQFLSQKILERSFEPVIVTGDFNAGEGNPAVRLLRARGFSDTFRAIHPNDSLVGTFHGFTGDRKGEKIDYIFVDKFARTVEATIVHTHQGDRYPSDHFPVTATIRFSKKGVKP